MELSRQATISTSTWQDWSDKYTNAIAGITIVPFNIVPDFCDVTYECVSVTRVDGTLAPDVDCTDFTLTATSLSTQVHVDRYKDKSWPPGEYNIEILGYSTEE